jgi:hypothetical protein
MILALVLADVSDNPYGMLTIKSVAIGTRHAHA